MKSQLNRIELVTRPAENYLHLFPEMFPFGRKRDPAEREEKERRKRDKREKQGQALESGGRLSNADLQRLEEVRRSLASKGGQPIGGVTSAR